MIILSGYFLHCEMVVNSFFSPVQCLGKSNLILYTVYCSLGCGKQGLYSTGKSLNLVIFMPSKTRKMALIPKYRICLRISLQILVLHSQFYSNFQHFFTILEELCLNEITHTENNNINAVQRLLAFCFFCCELIICWTVILFSQQY